MKDEGCARYAPLVIPALIGALAMAALSGCKSAARTAPMPGAALQSPHREPTADERRLLFAQIVEDAAPESFQEGAVLEGAPYKFFLRSLVGVKHDDLRKGTNEEVTFEKLTAQPGMYRGQVVTLPRGVVLEVSKAELPPEYGLAPGHSVLVAVFVDAARDVYALRILCPPKSTLYEKLDQGIQEDAVPVVRTSGYFMKLYARRTADPKEPPWRKPLLICPEPEFSQAAEPRKVWKELIDTNTARFLPSERIEAAGAEERMVVEVLPERDGASNVRADGKTLGGDLAEALSAAVAGFRKRLPPEQAEHPAAVVLVGVRGSLTKAQEVVTALRAAGVRRVAIKREM